MNYTRLQRLNNECTHSEYYAQWVTEHTRNTVINIIGIDRLLKSTDENLNDIPLGLWDSLPLYHSGFSKSDIVCVGKEAARQIIKAESFKEQN